MLNLEYQKYFKEHVPFTAKSMKHVYTVEFKRAIYTDEAFEVYRSYQQKVHKSKSESKIGFKRFLC